MKEIHNDSVQNRFTAYLMTAVTNKRNRYFAQRRRLQEQECPEVDLLEKNYSDFETQYRSYLLEKSAAVYDNLDDLQEVMRHLESERLIRKLEKLKEREKRILFARILGEQSFTELGEQLHLEPKQAELAYYYIIRKLRKELEGWKDEF